MFKVTLRFALALSATYCSNLRIEEQVLEQNSAITIDDVENFNVGFTDGSGLFKGTHACAQEKEALMNLFNSAITALQNLKNFRDIKDSVMTLQSLMGKLTEILNKSAADCIESKDIILRDLKSLKDYFGKWSYGPKLLSHIVMENQVLFNLAKSFISEISTLNPYQQGNRTENILRQFLFWDL